MEIINKIISWTHIITASLSIIFGIIVLYSKKGNSWHRKIGLLYFYSMLVNNITALFIYNISGGWTVPHTLAILILIVLLIGFFILKIKSSKLAMRIHITTMVISFWLLIGGAINEAFLHSDYLWELVNENDENIGLTHTISTFIFLILIIIFLKKYWNWKTA